MGANIQMIFRFKQGLPSEWHRIEANQNNYFEKEAFEKKEFPTVKYVNDTKLKDLSTLPCSKLSMKFERNIRNVNLVRFHISPDEKREKDAEKNIEREGGKTSQNIPLFFTKL